MDSERFDTFVKKVSDLTSRRAFVRGATAGAMGGFLGLIGIAGQTGLSEADAKSRRKKKKDRRKKKKKKDKRKEECNDKGKTCATPLNPCEQAVCQKHKCVTEVLADGASCGDGMVCNSRVCACPNGVCVKKVTPANMSDWFGYNDQNDTVDNGLLSFVAGPSAPLHGPGSVQMTVTGQERHNIATYQFAGTPLADITALKFTTYNPSTNPDNPGHAGYLHFNVDFDGSDVWQRRLVFVPRNNGTVLEDTWQEWDAIKGGAAEWLYSGTTWPVDGSPGTTPKTWNDILTQYPGVRIRATDAFLGIRIGEPYPDGYTGNVGSVTFGTDSTTIFAFEPNS